jgi:hypothetical protein
MAREIIRGFRQEKREMASEQRRLTPEEEWKYAETALRWHGWGSPVGLGLFVLAVAGAVAMIRWAFGT